MWAIFICLIIIFTCTVLSGSDALGTPTFEVYKGFKDNDINIRKMTNLTFFLMNLTNIVTNESDFQSFEPIVHVECFLNGKSSSASCQSNLKCVAKYAYAHNNTTPFYKCNLKMQPNTYKFKTANFFHFDITNENGIKSNQTQVVMFWAVTRGDDDIPGFPWMFVFVGCAFIIVSCAFLYRWCKFKRRSRDTESLDSSIKHLDQDINDQQSDDVQTQMIPTSKTKPLQQLEIEIDY